MKQKKYLVAFLLTVFALSLQSSNALNQDVSTFDDIDNKNNNAEAITYLKKKGVIEGYPDGTYRPERGINRAEFTKIIIKSTLKESEIQGDKCFPDVLFDWYAPYVCTAKRNGIIDGYPDGLFHPDKNISFVEATKIVSNAYKLGNKKNQGEWYEPFVDSLSEKNAIPLSIEYFDQVLSRDEMAEIVFRLLNDQKNYTSRSLNELYEKGFVKINSCEDLDKRYEFFQKKNEYFGQKELMLPEMSLLIDQSMERSFSVNEAGASSDSGSKGDYSSTNLQELGVDEADIIKNDGEYIYLLRNKHIKIVKAYPADQMRELTSFEFADANDFYPTAMYVDKNLMIVVGNKFPEVSIMPAMELRIWPPIYYSEKSVAYILNIEDKEKPKLLRSVTFDGSYRDSRKIDDTLYFISQKNTYPYRGIEYSDGISSVLPFVEDSSISKAELAADCSSIRILPKSNDSFGFLTVAAIPLNDIKSPVVREVIAGDFENIYASQNNLYITKKNYGSFFTGGNDSSSIYKFSISSGRVSFLTESKVPGSILNQFSMDEHRGNFRVATTYINSESDKRLMENAIYVLDSQMKIIGRLEALAPDEKIYSARFMGDRAYLVTFREIDPFFVIDLADPAKPKVLGELKIPGFSNYLHPYDDNFVIGFGLDTEIASDDFGGIITKGLKMGLFDVRDPNDPKELFSEIIGERGTYSELLYNHKALLFDKEKNLIAFPVTETGFPPSGSICSDFVYSNCPSDCKKVCAPVDCVFENGIKICNTDCDGSNSCVRGEDRIQTVFSGAYIFGLDVNKGFDLKAKITHLTKDEEEEMMKKGWSEYYTKNIDRLIYIRDSLFSISMNGIKANDLNDFSFLNYLTLTER